MGASFSYFFLYSPQQSNVLQASPSWHNQKSPMMLNQDSPRVPILSPQTPPGVPPGVHSPAVQHSPAFQQQSQHSSYQHSPAQFFQQPSPNMMPVQSPRVVQEGPKQVLEKLLDGSPAAVHAEASPMHMPILETTR